MKAKLYMRHYDAERDYEMLRHWWLCHSHSAPPSMKMLPKLGVLASLELNGEPSAAAFLYMDNSTGVCWIEYPVTRPGMKLSETRQALGEICNYLKGAAKSMNYGVMVAYTIPAIARELQRHGFVEARKNMTMLLSSTEVHNGN